MKAKLSIITLFAALLSFTTASAYVDRTTADFEGRYEQVECSRDMDYSKTDLQKNRFFTIERTAENDLIAIAEDGNPIGLFLNINGGDWTAGRGLPFGAVKAEGESTFSRNALETKYSIYWQGFGLEFKSKTSLFFAFDQNGELIAEETTNVAPKMGVYVPMIPASVNCFFKKID